MYYVFKQKYKKVCLIFVIHGHFNYNKLLLIISQICLHLFSYLFIYLFIYFFWVFIINLNYYKY